MLLQGKLFSLNSHESIKRFDSNRCFNVFQISNEAILSNPLRELRSIKNGLETCGIAIDHLNVPAVEEFVDEELNNSDKVSPSYLRSKAKKQCIIPHFMSDADTPEERELDEIMYRTSMEVFCDMKSGKAFREDYDWPDLPTTIGEKASGLLMINDPTKLSGHTNSKGNKNKLAAAAAKKVTKNTNTDTAVSKKRKLSATEDANQSELWQQEKRQLQTKPPSRARKLEASNP